MVPRGPPIRDSEEKRPRCDTWDLRRRLAKDPRLGTWASRAGRLLGSASVVDTPTLSDSGGRGRRVAEGCSICRPKGKDLGPEERQEIRVCRWQPAKPALWTRGMRGLGRRLLEKCPGPVGELAKSPCCTVHCVSGGEGRPAVGDAAVIQKVHGQNLICGSRHVGFIGSLLMMGINWRRNCSPQTTQ